MRSRSCSRLLRTSSTTTSRRCRVCTPASAGERGWIGRCPCSRARKSVPRRSTTKSGLMLGLGESESEVQELLRRLRDASVDIVTIGQYLRPSLENLPVAEYVAPEVFERHREFGEALGFRHVFAGPVRPIVLPRGRGAAAAAQRRETASRTRRERGWSRWTTPVAGAISGLLFALAFPPREWVILLPLALTPWLVALRAREEPRTGARSRDSCSASRTGAPRSRGSSTS